MLTAEIKVNDKVIATIGALQLQLVEPTHTDFIGDPSGLYNYHCAVTTPWTDSMDEQHWATQSFCIKHDRRFGWQGLLRKILSEILPTVVETISVEEG